MQSIIRHRTCAPFCFLILFEVPIPGILEKVPTFVDIERAVRHLLHVLIRFCVLQMKRFLLTGEKHHTDCGSCSSLPDKAL